MAEKSDSLITDDEYATIDEVEAAIIALTKVDLLKLRNYARLRIAAYGRFSIGVSAEDLLNEAISRTLEDDGRRWKKKSVSFVGLLMGNMRSISSNWTDGHIKIETPLDSSKENEKALKTCFIPRVVSESELLQEDEEGKIFNPIVSITPSNPIDEAEQIENAIDAKQRVDKIRQLFSKDQHVLDILDGWICEMTGQEIQTASGMAKNDYEAGVKRLRRTLGVY